MLSTRSPEQVVSTIINTQVYFTDYILLNIFMENMQSCLPLVMSSVPVNMDNTIAWLKRQFAPTLIMVEEIEG